jgi:muconate cycloisomerase
VLIDSVTAHQVRIPFKAAFGHALKTRRHSDAVIVVVHSAAGEVGVGEVLPREYLTGETITSVVTEHLPAMMRRWIGKSFRSRKEVTAALREEADAQGCALATLAGWEIAVLDIAGKSFGFRVGDLLGSDPEHELERGVVIDFEVPSDSLERYCVLLRLAGIRHIKVKVGLTDDLRRLEIVTGVFGADLPIRIDANGAWTEQEAISKLAEMRRFTLASIEQPVAAGDVCGMFRVRMATGIPVVADESLCSADDAARLIGANAADVFNIRVGKCGGLLASLRLVELARDAGLRCQLGTLVGETGILSRASEMFGSRLREFEFLDGKGQNRRLLTQDIVETNLTDQGLGISLIPERLKSFTISPPTTFCSN